MYLSKIMEVDGSNALGLGRSYYGGADPNQPPLPWGQSSAYMRPRGIGGSQYYNYQDRSVLHGKSKLGRDVFNRRTLDHQESEEDGEEELGRYRNGGQVKFQQTTSPKSSNPCSAAVGSSRDHWRRRRHGTESESSEYGQDEEDAHGGPRSHSQMPFKSSLGDSFVSEIGQSSGHRSGSGGRRGGAGSGKSGGSEAAGEDMADSIEDERDSQKKGVFGLLNQIYEMNNVTK